MTNYDRMRNISLEEMAKMIDDYEDEVVAKGCSAEHCVAFNADGLCGKCGTDICKQATVNWLKSEEW